MKQILCFGDSNTWGYNPENGTRFPWGVRWTSILQDLFSSQNIRILEDGLVGRTSVFDDALRPYRNGAKELPLSLELHDELEAVVLMLGTNDCKTYFKANPNVIGKGIETLIQQIRAKNPSIKILLVSPIALGADVWKDNFDPEFDEEAVGKSIALKGIYQKLAVKHHTFFLAASDYAGPSAADMEHMEASSHRKLAHAMHAALTDILAA